MSYDLVWVRGHVEVYDNGGNFYFSADNEREAMQELAEGMYKGDSEKRPFGA